MHPLPPELFNANAASVRGAYQQPDLHKALA